MNKRLLVVTATLALTLLMSGVGQGASFILSGDLLDVGVSSSGALVNDAKTQGITFKPGPLPNDSTLPGIPFEYYAIGIGGVQKSAGFDGTIPSPYGDNNAFGLSTINHSSGTSLFADSFGPVVALGGGFINYTQRVVFDKAFDRVYFAIDILNNSSVTIHDVIYGRGLDPDQDVLIGGGGGSFRTFNVINGDGSVTATGPLTNLFVTIRNLTPDLAGVPAVSGPLGGVWATDPYNLLAGGYLNGATGPSALEDASINMIWFVGDLSPGVCKDINFVYEFGAVPVPVPPSMILLGSGLLGLVGLRFRRNRA